MSLWKTAREMLLVALRFFQTAVPVNGCTLDVCGPLAGESETSSNTVDTNDYRWLIMFFSFTFRL